MGEVADRLALVRERLARACDRAGRDPARVRLVAVSKTKPPEVVREAYEAGQRDFGESYAQELRDKARELSELPNLRWHFIGRLQTNKARYVAPVASLVHAVDSEGLARELARRAGSRALPCLLEVNVAGERQKGGVAPAAAEELARAVRALPPLALRGLMTIPPAGEPAAPHFARLRRLREELSSALGEPLPELSMGMSEDFEEAIAEGSTIVRVGSAIFGPREAR